MPSAAVATDVRRMEARPRDEDRPIAPDPRRCRDVFLAAVEHLDPASRRDFLDRECSTDAALRRRVEDLLQSHDRPEDGDGRAAATSDAVTMDHAATPPGETASAFGRTASVPTMEGPGARIGPYKLLQPIGEGGMGVVYMAEQEIPVRRRVALKIIKAGMDSAQVVARFEAERQALAMMDHQSIARVLEAGATEGGRPYFVMELVNGVPITQYCDEAALDPRERLELFIPVCHAVQHAHQKGVVHRDIKPSNILVTLYDGEPVPKVIDFGIAKAVDRRLTERTMFTEFGSIVGTLEYMSPEQAEMSALGVDTRSDVYSLGVLLYELMTGSTPLERAKLAQAGYVEILKRIKEEEPPRPSTRLSSSGDRLPAISAMRRTEATKLSRLMRGELDWIVMKALEKDRSRRYETADGFARDVRRHLDGDPVEACPPSASYRLRKFVGRHRTALAAVSAFSTLLAIGSVLSAWQAIRATRAEAAAKAEGEKAGRSAEESRAVLRFFQDQVLAATRPEGVEGGLGKDVTIRHALDAAEPTIAAAFRDQPAVEGSLRQVLGQTYDYLGESKLAIRQHERAVDVRKALLGPDHPATLDSQSDLAEAYSVAGDLVRALPLFERTLASQSAVLGPDHPDTLNTQYNLAHAYRSSGRIDLATTMHERTLTARRATLGPGHRHTLCSEHDLAGTYLMAGRVDRAIPLFERNLAAWTAKFGADHPDALGCRSSLAGAYMAAGRNELAIAPLVECLAIQARKLGPSHPQTIYCRDSLAKAYMATGRHDLAIPILEAALDARTKDPGPDDPVTLGLRHELAFARRATDRVDLAVPLWERTLDGMRATLGRDHPDTLNVENSLAAAYIDQGDSARAEPMLREALAGRRRRLGLDHPHVAGTLAILGGMLADQRRWAEAEPLLRESLAIRDVKTPDDWNRFHTQSLLGGILLGREEYAAAEPLLLSGCEGMKSREAEIPAWLWNRLDQAVGRVVQLYASTGREEQVPAWRAKLDGLPGEAASHP
ncbi:serine/threonine-protein kinase [Paludisphaera mucosa]|uniref:Tetratricopeptide repeat protein n=1 Tax=Paludisphaera mucosa TaxID=3030827 RepID=A0ABT6FL79_9BACT|nr:serine/threonine-protein kinase [Paludisphaera mucosa]MDG3008333.1 tetratricopeptide repeat protein [Paludisphaera mucosa]